MSGVALRDVMKNSVVAGSGRKLANLVVCDYAQAIFWRDLA
jgi:hypothetical protein